MRHVRAVAALLGVLLAPGALGESHGGPAAHEGASLLFSISGGVSLGAYEAGSLYYGLAVTRANPGFARMRLVTGASAGSVNGLIAVLAACGAEARRPSDSLFWQTWIPLGLSGLSADPPTALAAFSRRVLETAADRLEVAFLEGLDPACDVVLGVAVTRVTPREVHSAGGLISVPRIEEKFAVRIRGRGQGQAPSIRNYVDPAFHLTQLLLPEAPDGEVPFSSLRELLLASSAFPVAFEPQRVGYCVFEAGTAERPGCPRERVQWDLFVDGGILDNAPLRLAARLAGGGLRPEGSGPRWEDAPSFGRFTLPRDALFVYVSPEIPAWPGERPVEDEGAPVSLTPLLGRLADGFVSTARAKELLTLAEEHPEIGLRTIAPRRHFPAASRPLSAFLGFVETQFRVFDFYLGMYDTRRMFEDVVLPAQARSGNPRTLIWPDLPFEAETGQESKVIGGWRPLACLHGVVEHEAELAIACDEPTLEDFRILLQASLERLYSDCAKRRPGDAALTRHDHCLAAMGGAPPPAVRGVEWPEGLEWQERPGEGDTAHALRLLSEHRFFFRDLGLRREDAGEALRAFRERVGDIATALAMVQPGAERASVGLASSLALNAVAFVPSRRALWATLGRDLELGFSRELAHVRHLPTVRVQAAGLVNRLSDLLSTDASRLSLSAVGGIEAVPAFLADYRTQTSLALRAGWLFALEDDFGSRPCLDPTRIGRCSGPLLQAVVSLSVIERIRLQLAWEHHLETGHRPRGIWSLSPGLGFQLAF
jgi:hypothetical protein